MYNIYCQLAAKAEAQVDSNFDLLRRRRYFLKSITLALVFCTLPITQPGPFYLF